MATYTHGHHESVMRSHRWRTAENSAAYLLDHLAPGLDVLDVGCGPGTITADLAARTGLAGRPASEAGAASAAPGRVTAIDSSEAVLDEARQVAAERGVTNIEFAVADVHALDFPDGSFDVVHAHQVLQHVGDPVTALREMRRVSRPGGIVAARDSDYAAMTWYPEVPELDAWLDLYRDVARRNGGEPDAGRRLHAWARQAGFSEVVPSASVWCFATDEDRAWWSGMWADRIKHSAIAGQALAAGYPQEELDRISEGWRKWGAVEDGWFAVLHGEVLCRP